MQTHADTRYINTRAGAHKSVEKRREENKAFTGIISGWCESVWFLKNFFVTPFYIFQIFGSENAIILQFENSKKRLNFAKEKRDFLEGSGIYEATYQVLYVGDRSRPGS